MKKLEAIMRDHAKDRAQEIAKRKAAAATKQAKGYAKMFADVCNPDG